jgi:hypothetical protein
MRSSGAPPHTPGDRLGFVMDVPCDIGLGAQALSRSGWIELGGYLGARIRHATTAREVPTCMPFGRGAVPARAIVRCS